MEERVGQDVEVLRGEMLLVIPVHSMIWVSGPSQPDG